MHQNSVKLEDIESVVSVELVGSVVASLPGINDVKLEDKYPPVVAVKVVKSIVVSLLITHY